MKVVNLVEFTCPIHCYIVVYSILRNKIYDFYRAVGESSLPNNANGSFRSTKPELKFSY